MRRVVLGCLAGLLALAGCKSNSSSGGDNVTYAIQVTSAPPTTATVGTAIPLSVKVTKQVNGGSPAAAAGITASLTVTAGGGTVTPGSVSTASDGTASATWTLGNTPGTQTLHIAVSTGESADVSITATARAASALTITTQPAATALAGQPLTRQPVIQLRDANGAAVAQAGVVVTASVASGNGTLSGSTTATTDANGVATFNNLIIAGASGTTTLRFTATLAGQSATVTASATSVSQPTLVVSNAPSTSAPTGVPLFVQPTVQLQDGAGNPIHQAGVAVTASATGGPALSVGPGSTATLTATTDANGVATFHDLALTGSGTGTIVFNATGYQSASTAAVTVTAAATQNLANATLLPFNAPANTVSYYHFTSAADVLSMNVASTEGTGTVVLYVRKGAYPTSSDYDCRSNAANITAQICNFSSNVPGDWYVAVQSVTAVSNALVRMYAFNAACNTTPITLGVQVTGTVSSSTGCLTNIDAAGSVRYHLNVPTTTYATITGNSNVTVRLAQQGQVSFYVTFGSSTTVSSGFYIPAGDYDVFVEAGSTAPANYAVTIATASAPTSCVSLVFVTPNVALDQQLTSTDCVGTQTGFRSDYVAVYLGPGVTITATMSSTDFDPLIRLFDGPSGNLGLLASDDNGGGGTTARLSFTGNGTLSSPQAQLELTSASLPGLGNYHLVLTYSPVDYIGLRAPGSSGSDYPGLQFHVVVNGVTMGVGPRP